MNTARELTNTTKMVKDILIRDCKARNNDNYLWYIVLKETGMKNGIDIEKMSIPTFLLHMKEYGFPPFETVRRSRQKIQQNYPELASCNSVENGRMVNEEVYRNYARKVGV